ncbi:sigma-70 family RNA polymerase sigma factor [Streptomyces scopuliridis]|uniref:sigma-70 family RNA polymerase sigma factor n=1 Tax=Streptomyces scopuliridis TaxID=452529 RepID=UPI0036C01E65
MWVTDWTSQAACRTRNPGELSTEELAQGREKAVCTGCSVRTECLADALDNRVVFGVWGGMTERERRALLRRRPTVVSWATLLKNARLEYERSVGVRPGPSFDEEFEALFREYFVRLVGFLIKAGARQPDAEDSVQSAFVELAGVWDAVSHRSAWLRTTAYRKWLRLVRKNHIDELVFSLPEDPADDATNDVVGRSQIIQLLRQLPPMQQAVMAFGFDGCSPAETAEAMGVPADNVRQNLRRARSNLSRLIEKNGML